MIEQEKNGLEKLLLVHTLCITTEMLRAKPQRRRGTTDE